MQTSLNARRLDDGSIDFTFYRRRAARRRRLAQRIIFRRYGMLVLETVRATVVAIGKPLLQGGGYRWVARAGSAATVLFAVAASLAWAQSPAGHHAAGDHLMVAPSELTWAGVPSMPPGAQIAIIQGPMSEAKPFTVRLKFPANYRIPAHSHPAIEHVTVISGIFNMGTGDKLDQSKTRTLPPGSVAIMQSETNHFAWTSEATIVQLHGVGPWGIKYVNPADDPRKK